MSKNDVKSSYNPAYLIDAYPEYDEQLRMWIVCVNDYKGNQVEAFEFDTEEEGDEFIDAWLKLEEINKPEI
jgi:hypothetical protein